jgi:hypothetical protein
MQPKRLKRGIIYANLSNSIKSPFSALPDYQQDLATEQHFIAPAINPFSEKSGTSPQEGCWLEPRFPAANPRFACIPSFASDVSPSPFELSWSKLGYDAFPIKDRF